MICALQNVAGTWTAASRSWRSRSGPAMWRSSVPTCWSSGSTIAMPAESDCRPSRPAARGTRARGRIRCDPDAFVQGRRVVGPAGHGPQVPDRSVDHYHPDVADRARPGAGRRLPRRGDAAGRRRDDHVRLRRRPRRRRLSCGPTQGLQPLRVRTPGRHLGSAPDSSAATCCVRRSGCASSARVSGMPVDSGDGSRALPSMRCRIPCSRRSSYILAMSPTKSRLTISATRLTAPAGLKQSSPT